MDIKEQAMLAVALSKEYPGRNLCPHDCLIAVGLALRERDPGFALMMRDFPPDIPMRAGTTLMAVALHENPFNLDGDWGWHQLLSRHKYLDGDTFVSSTSMQGQPSKEAFEVSEDDWFDLVNHDAGLIDDIQAMGKWLAYAVQTEVDHEFIVQSTPNAPKVKTSKRL